VLEVPAGAVLSNLGGQMNAADSWFIVLVAVCCAGSYALGVPPSTRRQWAAVAVTIALLAWLLPLMASLRSQ
jgi:hypothetical protein